MSDYMKNGQFRSKVLDFETFDAHRHTMKNALSLTQLPSGGNPGTYLDERTAKNIRNISYL